MKQFKFKYFKTRRIKDNQEGIVLMGEKPDHKTPLEVINGYFGKPVLEVNGYGIGVNLFLPETHLDDWQKLALFKEAWLETKTDEKEQIAILDLDLLRSKHV